MIMRIFANEKCLWVADTENIYTLNMDKLKHTETCTDKVSSKKTMFC
jgi:hypothetical protein